ncbi:Adenosylmethionine-8-amino-7-oxononanoate aminotransferase [Mucisphaera calidilacus]|uniref:Adenosylmethionine-8-amino-7-oxononanoate aminotransferase n=2 Tax=Mucisphaera calidilacus TaxID=2527982 RepID=A0A518C179_9BACT|nr:Adenosylmethionine-8-amino-7-oxononanoate aminotransferase [Mucisphaera calidilacus]
MPYAQMKLARVPYRVRSASGCVLELEDGTRLIDGLSSWWAVVHGYDHPEILRAAHEQVDRLPHVMLGGLSHEPAQRLAEKLAAITPGDLRHTFFADSGSVAVEVALKIATQYHRNLGHPQRHKMVALRLGYHGDTTGAMAVSDPEDSMHHLFAPILMRHHFAPSPRGGFDAEPEVVQKDLEALERLIREHESELAGMICEPILQAAGGFNMYSPSYLRGARRLCDAYGLLLIFDEIATGLGRTGRMFAADHAGVVPDVMTLGKALTAGYTGHAAVVTRPGVFDAFYSDNPEHALMHGPTFMGNPTACAVALAGLEVFEREGYLDRIAQIEEQLQERLLPLTGPAIASTRVLGATGVVEVFDPEAIKGLQAYAAARGVWLRPFGTYAYTMPPYVITDEQLSMVLDVFEGWFG